MVEIPEDLHQHLTDSAGQPWAGRTFSDNPWKDDDGSAPGALIDALAAFRAGAAPSAHVIDALRDARVLIPLVAELGEAGTTESGLTVDKSADLSIVTVEGPDGRGCVPVFSSAEAMRRWDADARPVPAEARRAALAAAAEGAEVLILDPGSDETEFLIRRPAAWAIAQGTDYLEPWRDQAVLDAAAALLDESPELAGLDLRPGDPGCRYAGPEVLLIARIPLEQGTTPDRAISQPILERLSDRIASMPALAERVDSVALSAEFVPQPEPTPSESRARIPGESSRRRGLWGRRRG